MVKSRMMVTVAAAWPVPNDSATAMSANTTESVRIELLPLPCEIRAFITTHFQRDAAHAVDAALHDTVAIERDDLDLFRLEPLDRLPGGRVHDDLPRLYDEQVLRREAIVLVARDLDDGELVVAKPLVRFPRREGGIDEDGPLLHGGDHHVGVELTAVLELVSDDLKRHRHQILDAGFLQRRSDLRPALGRGTVGRAHDPCVLRDGQAHGPQLAHCAAVHRVEDRAIHADEEFREGPGKPTLERRLTPARDDGAPGNDLHLRTHEQLTHGA